MVKEFDQNIHYRMLCAWWESRGLPIIPIDMLPTYGLIVDQIAAGFLIVTDCNLGFLEFYITNPESDKSKRDIAIDKITSALIRYGQAVGISNFKCDTQIPAIRDRAEKFGFKFIGQFSNYFLKVRE